MMLPSLVCPCINAMNNNQHSPLYCISPSRIGDLLKSMKGLLRGGYEFIFFEGENGTNFYITGILELNYDGVF